MNPILNPEAIQCLEEMGKAIDEIREAIYQAQDWSFQLIEESIRSIRESTAQLSGMEQILAIEPLQELRQDLERARERVKQLSNNPFLNLSQMEQIRMSLEQSLKLLQNADDAAQGFREEMERIRNIADKLEARNQKWQSSLQQALRPVEDILDGMRRDLTLLEELSEPEATVRLITNLLRRSLRLAIFVLRPEGLQKMAETSPRYQAWLQQGWGKWLQELGGYVQEVYRQSLQMASLAGGISEPLEVLRAVCEEIASKRFKDFPSKGSSAPSSGGRHERL